MRRSSTDETPYRRSPSLDSKPDTPPFTSGFHRFSGEFEYKRPPFAFGFHTTKGPQTSKGRYAQGKKYVVFYLDLSFIFLLELRRCRMAEGCMMALRYGMVFFNLLFWVSSVFFLKKNFFYIYIYVNIYIHIYINICILVHDFWRGETVCFAESDTLLPRLRFFLPRFFFFFPKELSYAYLCNHSDLRGVRRGQSWEKETDHAFRSCVQSPLCGWVEPFLLPIQFVECGCALHCLPC